MNAPLQFPPIAEVEPIGALTTDAPIDLSKVDLTAVALAQFGDWRADVAAAKAKLTGLVLDLATQSKVDEAKSLRHRTVNQPIAEVRKVSKALKSKLASVSKAIGAEEDEAVAAWGDVGAILTPQIDTRQAELDAEKAERERIEAERVAGHIAKINSIRSTADRAKGIESARIQNGIAQVEALAFGPECEDFLPKYEAAKAETLALMRGHLADSQAREAAEAQRLENERIAAELEAQRKALAERAAELKRQQEEAQAARVAITHAAVFLFPEPVKAPEAHPADADPAVEPVRYDPSAGSADARSEPVERPPVSLVTANKAARAAIAEMVEQAPDLVNTSDLCAMVGLSLSTQEIQGFGLVAQDTPTGKRGTFWLKADADKLTDAIVSHLLKLKAERN